MASNKWRHCGIGLLLFCACEQRAIYQNMVAFAHCQWPVDTVLDFSFPIKDTAQAYDIVLLVKNTPDYPYQNLYITYYLEDDASHLLHKELKNYMLFDVKTGKPLGRGRWKSKSHTLLVAANHHFSHPGSYALKLEHFMRTDTLPGLQAIGIKVILSKQIPQ